MRLIRGVDMRRALLVLVVLVVVAILVVGCNDAGMWYIPQVPQTR
jgi:hypothetical protein